MNINDFDSPHYEGEKDRLDLIFERQHELEKEYFEIEKENGLLHTVSQPVDLHDRFGQARIKDIAWRIVEELGEACNCLKNKPWKQTHVMTDEDHFFEELADAFHFVVELLLTVGVGPDELFDLYFRKSEVNKFRQRSKY